MKNFSVKTADFDSLSISGESPIVQSDLGTAPNQIPLNKDLGSLAYMNAPQIEDLNVDTLELREIAAELSDTAVDVFVYDTRRDSDGGAWRHRTSHTSWYNEELNTATRGSRREFPAVAVIVAETNKVTIYDGDDPDLPMWMVFNADVAGKLLNTTGGNTSLAALNGDIFVGCSENVYGGVSIKIAFISDTSFAYANNQITQWPTGLSGRDLTVNYTIFVHSYGLVSLYVNDVAMTVLPNAPIDSDTGLPIPTIAVATDGGVSVIKDDGSVTSSNTFGKIQKVSITQDYKLYVYRDAIYDYVGTHGAIDSDLTDTYRFDVGSQVVGSGATLHTDTALSTSKFNLTNQSNDIVVGQDYGISKLNNTVGDFQKELYNVTTSTYNTGWMPGDIKLATLSDTKNETVGVDETTELINLNDGYADGGSWTINSNTQVSTTTSTDALNYYRTGLTTQTGKKYTATLTITNYTGSGDLGVASLVSGVIGSNLRLSANGTITIQFNGSNEEISLFYRSTNTATIEISIKETGELITNGTFDNGTEGWTGGNGATIIEDGGKIKITSTTGGNGYAYQQINTIVGRKYIMTFDFFAVDASTALAWIGTSAGGGQTLQEGFSGAVDSSRVLEFTATSSIHYIRIGANETAVRSYMFDNISIRLAEDDRSVNDNGLQVFGEITKTPVAPGADLVAYSGFSANNYLVQPYNPDLDFGTGDFCIMGWAKTTSTDNQRIFTRNLDVNNRLIVYTISGGMSFYIQQDGDASWIQSTQEIDHGSWFNFCCSRRSGVIEVYVDGKKQDNGSSSNIDIIRDIDFGQVDSWIGNSPNNTDLYFRGLIALLRISSTVPSVEQIAKIYRDEKPLFQDGAQATLYGTSDAVTALAYDDSDDLLHVGTASGRSVFNGLKRVDNTTTAVSTAISATEGLVIEQ